MPRRLATLAAVASLVLCVATLALWVRSYFRSDLVRYAQDSETTRRSWHLLSAAGRIEYNANSFLRSGRSFLRAGWTYAVGPSGNRASRREQPSYYRKPYGNGRFRAGSFLAFGFVNSEFPAGEGQQAFWFPHWSLALLFAILPALRLLGTLRSGRRGRAGRCVKCGYDLRATPDRCPECGAVPAAEPSAR